MFCLPRTPASEPPEDEQASEDASRKFDADEIKYAFAMGIMLGLAIASQGEGDYGKSG